jgi:hypothetical protein
LWRTPRSAIRATLFVPAPFILVISAVILFVLTRNILLIYWDEFSHWGSIVKVLLATNRLPISEGIPWQEDPVTIIFSQYPPGDALFQYFISRPFAFAEGNLIFGRSLFQVAALLPLVAKVRWREPQIYVPLVAIGLVAGYIFSEAQSNWTTLLIDNIVAMLFAASFTIYFSAGAGKRAVLCALPVVAALTIFKEVGFQFALVFAAIVLFDQLTQIFWNGFESRGKAISRIVVCVTVIATPIAFNYLWSLHEIQIHASPILDASWRQARERLLDPSFGRTFLTIADRFGTALAGGFPVGNAQLGLNVWIPTIAILAVISLAVQKTVERALRVALLHLIMAPVFAAYLASLFYYYLFAYGTFEAFQLAGFSRYVGTFLLAWMLISVGLIIYDPTPQMKRWVVVPAIVVIACAAVYVTRASARTSIETGARHDDFSNHVMDVRRTVRDRLGAAIDGLPANARIFSMWGGTTGLAHYVTFFELRPHPMNYSCFSLGGKRYDADIWSCDWTSDLLRQKLEPYDYVFIGKADDIFWNKYQSLFTSGARDSNATLFRVDHSSPVGLLYPVNSNSN